MTDRESMLKKPLNLLIRSLGGLKKRTVTAFSLATRSAEERRAWRILAKELKMLEISNKDTISGTKDDQNFLIPQLNIISLEEAIDILIKNFSSQTTLKYHDDAIVLQWGTGEYAYIQIRRVGEEDFVKYQFWRDRTYG